MSGTADYSAWNLWLMRNCAKCTKDPCTEYARHRALAQTWRKDYAKEPNCPDKVT